MWVNQYENNEVVWNLSVQWWPYGTKNERWQTVVFNDKLYDFVWWHALPRALNFTHSRVCYDMGRQYVNTNVWIWMLQNCRCRNKIFTEVGQFSTEHEFDTTNIARNISPQKSSLIENPQITVGSGKPHLSTRVMPFQPPCATQLHITGRITRKCVSFESLQIPCLSRVCQEWSPKYNAISRCCQISLNSWLWHTHCIQPKLKWLKCMLIVKDLVHFNHKTHLWIFNTAFFSYHLVFCIPKDTQSCFLRQFP